MPHSDKTIRVLRIEQSKECHESLICELNKISKNIIFQTVSSSFELREQIMSQRWNLVISSYSIADLSTLEALNIVKSYSSELPFIVLSDKIEVEGVADMMKAGVEDVVMNCRLERLIPTVNRILREHEIRDKEARAHKMANEAFAAKEQMLAIVSHDIKNPLSAIQLEAQMLLRATERSGKSLLAEEVKIQANRILKTTDRLKLLISDLLDKNKSENGLAQVTKSNIDAIRLVQEVMDASRPLIQEKEIILQTKMPPAAIISMDRNKMFQVFSNLISNAIKFTPKGGLIQISLEENEQEFMFSVNDSGPGLEEKELKKVFEKYWTGNAPDGTGLGLFICKTIVEAHEGNIFVENVHEGAGARFKFTLPKIAADIKKTSFSYYENRKDLRKKIYIIDDDEDLREVMSWALGKEGYAIHSFHSPQESLDWLMRGHSLPDLIVVDFHMDEMKGSDFLLKKDDILVARSCPVLMITASPQEVEKEVPSNFYKEVLTKPIDLEGLVEKVRKTLND